MQNGYRSIVGGIVYALGLVAAVAWAQTAPPPSKPKLERLRVAVAPLGWDTNFTWLNPRSGNLDKRQALEFLVGIDHHTGAYIPQLAEQWEMAPDGKSWTITLRKGVKFHEHWGEFTARDVRHAVFLITQPGVHSERLQRLAYPDGCDEDGHHRGCGQESGRRRGDRQRLPGGVRLKQAAPKFVEMLSANTDLPMESKARWDAGGKEPYGQKVVGTGPFEFVERKVGAHVLYKRIENHWRQTPEYKELEFRWVPEDVTRLATLLSGEVHISDVPRALQENWHHKYGREKSYAEVWFGRGGSVGGLSAF